MHIRHTYTYGKCVYVQAGINTYCVSGIVLYKGVICVLGKRKIAKRKAIKKKAKKKNK